jgi:anti-sigma factor RsiW
LDSPPDNENTLRRFLLGTLPAAEREAIEDRFMVESDLFDALNASEEDLLEEYARGELSLPERQQIERHLLLVPRNRERLKLLSTMHTAFERGQVKPDTVSEHQKKDRSFFRLTALRYALAACLVLMCGIVWWLLPGRTREDSLQANNTPHSGTAQPTPPLGPAAPADPALVANKQQAAEGSSSPPVNNNAVPQTSPLKDRTVPPRAVARPFVATLLLTPGATRSESSVSELILPAKAQAAQIKLVLETDDHTRYRAVLSDEDGAPVWTSGALKARSQTITLNIPRRFLREGDYLINLSGQTAGNGTRVADYSFRIRTP